MSNLFEIEREDSHSIQNEHAMDSGYQNNMFKTAL